MYASVPAGITPPAPGLEKEEPTFWIEDDIPTDDGGEASEDSAEGSRHKPERE